MRKRARTFITILAGLTALSAAAGETVTWSAASGDWSGAGNWTPAHVPTNGDDVVINSGADILLAGSTSNLLSLTMSGGTLTFSNWTTVLSATDVTLNGGSKMTCSGAFLENTVTSRVYIVCSNLNIASSSASIDVTKKGYMHGEAANKNGNGPGGGIGRSGAYHGTGAGHGGAGGGAIRYGTINHGLGKVIQYGDASAPVWPGSGGGGTVIYPAWRGGDGGGAVRIVADGVVTVNGVISANAGNGVGRGGGGAGGSIYITCNTIAGSGNIQANGGPRGDGLRGAGGGGGRIAVDYDPTDQAAIPSITFQANPGLQGFGMGPPDPGTIWFPNTLFVTETISRLSGQIVIPGFTSWSPTQLVIDGCWVRFPTNGFDLNVAGDMTITGSGARYDVGGSTYDIGNVKYHRPLSVSTPVLEVGGNLDLLNGGSLGVFSAQTNGVTPDYGAWVNVAQDMLVSTNSWVYPYSHTTNGGSPYFTMQNLTITTNAGFNADNKGYGVNNSFYGWGPGNGGGTNAASYGGHGGDTNSPVKRTTYGSLEEPMSPGSSAGKTASYPVPGSGGGLIRVTASGTLTLNGELTAGGYWAVTYQSLTASPHGIGSGGSGGAIYVRCKRFEGYGRMETEGGYSWRDGGGGGGGRIAVWSTYNDTWTGSYSVDGGSLTALPPNDLHNDPATYPGAPGTIYWGYIPPRGAVLLIR